MYCFEKTEFPVFFVVTVFTTSSIQPAEIIKHTAIILFRFSDPSVFVILMLHQSILEFYCSTLTRKTNMRSISTIERPILS